MLQSGFDSQVKKLSKQSEKDAFQPHWHDIGTPTQQQDREYVNGQLMQGAQSPHQGVWTSRVFHGPPSEQVASDICETGLTSRLAKTKGWFGEGPYVSKDAAYALRYCWQSEFWNNPGKTGFLVAGQACFSNVYPVTQADNSEGPWEPGLKGKPIGGRAALGTKGCDAHFVLVRPVPPHGCEKRRTYHACHCRERHEGSELALSQEAQFLPEYIIEVVVKNDEHLLERAKKAAAERDAETLASMLEGISLNEVGGGTNTPAGQPTSHPTNLPTRHTATQPSTCPNSHTHMQPASQPHMLPTLQPCGQPCINPTKQLQLQQQQLQLKQQTNPLEAQIWELLREAAAPMDTLAMAKACGLMTQKEVNPTLYKLKGQNAILNVANHGQRPLWVVAD